MEGDFPISSSAPAEQLLLSPVTPSHLIRRDGHSPTTQITRGDNNRSAWRGDAGKAVASPESSSGDASERASRGWPLKRQIGGESELRIPVTWLRGGGGRPCVPFCGGGCLGADRGAVSVMGWERGGKEVMGDEVGEGKASSGAHYLS